MTVNQFVDFIEYFQNHNFKFISPEDLLADLKNDQPYAMITFDDGYFNNMLAFEILNKYKIPAVLFITTKNMSENKSFWWDIIYKYRTRQGCSVDSIRNEQRTLKSYKHFLIDKYIIENFGIESFTPWSDIDRPFNENEVKNLAENPYISVGNHTHNHSILTNYTKEEIIEELRHTNKILFDLTGKLPISIAFPNGNYDNLVLKSVEEEGFRFAFNTESKKNNLPLENAKLICLNRFYTSTTKISEIGSFCRLGYEPDLLYTNMKKHIKSSVKGKWF
jgi:peptidoglycan/xylan/chitin deacetylase (PgdA/CDA1 family)